jgi:translation initiation factor 1 (eIF-1/SUI1)
MKTTQLPPSQYVRQDNLDISIQQRSTKKCVTIVQGMPEDIDLKIILKAWKKVNHPDPVIQL